MQYNYMIDTTRLPCPGTHSPGCCWAALCQYITSSTLTANVARPVIIIATLVELTPLSLVEVTADTQTATLALLLYIPAGALPCYHNSQVWGVGTLRWAGRALGPRAKIKNTN